jgi:hypothetical protein
MAIWHRGVLGFLKSFVPHGAPWALMPVLIPIEVISLLAREERPLQFFGLAGGLLTSWRTGKKERNKTVAS